jgi:hypothetical protein
MALSTTKYRTEVVQPWLKSFPRLPLDDAIARETVLLRQQHGIKSVEKSMRLRRKQPKAKDVKGLRVKN